MQLEKKNNFKCLQAPKPCIKARIHGITALTTLLKFLVEQWKNKQTFKRMYDNKLGSYQQLRSIIVPS